MTDVAERHGKGRAVARGWMRLALVAAVLLVLGALTFGSMEGYFDVEEVRLPDVTGRTLDEASRVLRERGLEVDSYPDQAVDQPPDVVTRQAPSPGARVRRARVVSLGVNTPAEGNRTPTLVGMREAEATATLADLNLRVGDVEYRFGDAPAGRVVAQTPGAGDPAGSGGTVSLVVSRGPAPEPVEVPDVEGMDLDAARAQLRDAGFRRVETLPTRLGRRNAGEVTVQSPPPGQEAAPGTVITLQYALDGGRVVEVPPVEGLAPRSARAALERAGLQVAQPVEYVDRSDTPRGVVEVQPDGLTLVDTPVRLVVNGVDRGAFDPEGGVADPRAGVGLGPGEDANGADDDGDDDEANLGGRVVPFRFVPEELGVSSLVENEYHLRLVVQDAQGERTVVDERVPAGESVEERVRVHGDSPLLQTYVNDVFFQAWRP